MQVNEPCSVASDVTLPPGTLSPRLCTNAHMNSYQRKLASFKSWPWPDVLRKGLTLQVIWATVSIQSTAHQCAGLSQPAGQTPLCRGSPASPVRMLEMKLDTVSGDAGQLIHLACEWPTVSDSPPPPLPSFSSLPVISLLIKTLWGQLEQ